MKRPADGTQSRQPGQLHSSPDLGDDGPQGRGQLANQRARRRPRLAVRGQAPGLPSDRAFDQSAGTAHPARRHPAQVQSARAALAGPDHLGGPAQRAALPLDPSACRQARAPGARRPPLGPDREFRSRGHHAAVPAAQATERAAQHHAVAAGGRRPLARSGGPLGAASRPPAAAVHGGDGRRQRRSLRPGPRGGDPAGPCGERVRETTGRLAADQHQRAHAQGDTLAARGCDRLPGRPLPLVSRRRRQPLSRLPRARRTRSS